MAIKQNLESHTNILNNLSNLGREYNYGQISRAEILNYCLRAWNYSFISRHIMVSTLKNQGVRDVNLLEKILKINPDTLYDPKFVNRPFSKLDAQSIVETLVKYQKYDTYEAITNKVITQNDAQEFTIANIALQKMQLNQLAKQINLKSADFKDATWTDSDCCYHDFLDPKLKDKNWFWYRFFPKMSEGVYGCENITTRFYLKPKNHNLIQVWTEIMQKIEKLPSVRKSGYTTKIPNYFNLDYENEFKSLVLGRAATMLNQNDRIVLYCGDIARDEILNAIQTYCSNKFRLFEPYHSLASPLLDTTGKPFGFVYTADEFEIGDLSFNEIQARILDEILIDYAKRNQKRLNLSSSVNQKEQIKEILNIISKNTTQRLNLESFIFNNYPKIAPKYNVNLSNIGFMS